MSTPEFIPTLSAGAHLPEGGEACVMEMVALLAGEEWTDRPLCTHPYLAAAAQGVNDGMTDEFRHLLVPMICRLFGTGNRMPSVTDRLERELTSDWVASAVKAMRQYPQLSREQAYCDQFYAIANYWASWSPRNGVKFLSNLIDLYDQVAGRTEITDVSAAQLADLDQQVRGMAA